MFLLSGFSYLRNIFVTSLKTKLKYNEFICRSTARCYHFVVSTGYGTYNLGTDVVDKTDEPYRHEVRDEQVYACAAS